MVGSPTDLMEECLVLASPAAFVVEQPATEITPGVYHSQGTDFVNDTLKVESWFQDSYLISGSIEEQSTLTFQARVQTVAHGESNHFVGDGSMIYGSCSWPMKMEVFAFVGHFYVQEYIPYPTFGPCGDTSSYVWRYNMAPFIQAGG